MSDKVVATATHRRRLKRSHFVPLMLWTPPRRLKCRGSTGFQWKPKTGMTDSRKREASRRPSTDESESYRHNRLVESRLCRALLHWHHSCLSDLSMAIKQNTKRWADPILQDQSSPSSRKSAKHSRVRKLEERRNEPLNVLGCLALIHAIRSVNSGQGPQVCSGRAMVA
jgi:hypothetical protein